MIFLLFCSFSRAGEWIADAGSGIKVWNPNPVPGESVRWTGGAVDGLASGEGELTWFLHGRVNGRYRGGMRRGIYNGVGAVEWFDKHGNVVSRYSGGWLNDKYHGAGIFEKFRDGKSVGKREGFWIKHKPVSKAEWLEFQKSGGLIPAPK